MIAQTLCKRRDGRGRVAAVEIMIGTPAVRNLIRENKIHQLPSSIQTGQKHGMQSLEQHLRELIARGTITKGEAGAKLPNPEVLDT